MCCCCAAYAEELLQFGLKRIEKFEHIGTTEKLFPSVESAAASLHMPIGGTAYGAGEVSGCWIKRPCKLLLKQGGCLQLEAYASCVCNVDSSTCAAKLCRYYALYAAIPASCSAIPCCCFSCCCCSLGCKRQHGEGAVADLV